MWQRPCETGLTVMTPCRPRVTTGFMDPELLAGFVDPEPLADSPGRAAAG